MAGRTNFIARLERMLQRVSWNRVHGVSHAENLSPDPSHTISQHGFTRKARAPFCLSVPFSMYRKAQGRDTESEGLGKEALWDSRFPGNSRKPGGSLGVGWGLSPQLCPVSICSPGRAVGNLTGNRI